MYSSSLICFRRINHASHSVQTQENVMTKSQVKNEVDKCPVVAMTKKEILVIAVNVVFLCFLVSFTSDRGDRV